MFYSWQWDKWGKGNPWIKELGTRGFLKPIEELSDLLRQLIAPRAIHRDKYADEQNGEPEFNHDGVPSSSAYPMPTSSGDRPEGNRDLRQLIGHRILRPGIIAESIDQENPLVATRLSNIGDDFGASGAVRWPVLE